MDWKLHHDEHAVRWAFSRFDRDGSGVIGRCVLAKLLNDRRVIDNLHVELDVFARADVNSDGLKRFDEFYATVQVGDAPQLGRLTCGNSALSSACGVVRPADLQHHLRLPWTRRPHAHGCRWPGHAQAPQALGAVDRDWNRGAANAVRDVVARRLLMWYPSAVISLGLFSVLSLAFLFCSFLLPFRLLSVIVMVLARPCGPMLIGCWWLAGG